MTETETATIERSRALVVGAWEALGRSKRGQPSEYFTEDYVRHSETGDQSLDDLRETIQGLIAGFPDLKTTMLDVIVEGDRAAFRWETVGTHRSRYMDVPATNKWIKSGGINIVRIEDGRIAEEWSSWGKASFLNQLGIVAIG